MKKEQIENELKIIRAFVADETSEYLIDKIIKVYHPALFSAGYRAAECEWCDEIFISNRKAQKFCSDLCRKENKKPRTPISRLSQAVNKAISEGMDEMMRQMYSEPPERSNWYNLIGRGIYGGLSDRTEKPDALDSDTLDDE